MTIELGGNITLTGFADRDFTDVIVVKKIVGQYARKLSDTVGLDFLKVTLKTIGSGKFEIHIRASSGGKEISSESTEHNLFVALDSALKKTSQQANTLHAKS